MTTFEKYHFRATKIHQSHAWAMIGLVVAFACLIALANGLDNWSGLVIYGVASLALLISLQPWRSYLELDHHGFRVVGGARSTVIRWCDVTGLRPARQRGGRYGGVTFTAVARPIKLFGLFHVGRGAVITGTIDAKLYGISDGQLHQLMTHLWAGDDSRTRHVSAGAAGRLGGARAFDIVRPQASARRMIDRAF